MRPILYAAVAAAAATGSAGAEENHTPPDDRRLDVVVVTATGRETRLQDVPLSVTAFDDETLALSGI